MHRRASYQGKEGKLFVHPAEGKSGCLACTAGLLREFWAVG